MSAEDTIKTVVTQREASIEHTVKAETQSAETPNILVQPMSMLALIGVRATRVYVQSLLGFLTVVPMALAAGILPAEITTMLLPAEFGEKLWLAARLAVAPATVSLLQNGLELLIKLDESFPKLRA